MIIATVPRTGAMSLALMLAKRVDFTAASRSAIKPVEGDTRRFPARGSTMAFATVVTVLTSGFEAAYIVGMLARKNIPIRLLNETDDISSATLLNQNKLGLHF